MTRYLVEAYSSRASDSGELEARAREAAEAVAASGTPIRHLTSIHVPDDEISFHLFEADSADSVRLVNERADITAQRIVEAGS
ncbi:MAG TPA: nickel-binding protein [Candidatus Limnocylindria bacterium]